MSEKHYAEVLIDGVVYTLGGQEDEAYLRRVAAYLSEKIGEVRKQKGYSRMSAEYQNLLLQLNVADDYFKEKERGDLLEAQKNILEREAYSLKHELITTQMKLEALQKEQKKDLRAGGQPADAEAGETAGAEAAAASLGEESASLEGTAPAAEGDAAGPVQQTQETPGSSAGQEGGRRGRRH